MQCLTVSTSPSIKITALFMSLCVMHAAQPRGLTMPVAATLKPRTFSAPEDVSQPTSIQQLSTSMPSGRDYLSIARDVLSKEHRASSTASITSLNSPTQGKYIYSIFIPCGFYFMSTPQLGLVIPPMSCNGTLGVIFELLRECPAPSMLQFMMTRHISGPIAAGKSIHTI